MAEMAECKKQERGTRERLYFEFDTWQYVRCSVDRLYCQVSVLSYSTQITNFQAPLFDVIRLHIFAQRHEHTSWAE